MVSEFLGEIVILFNQQDAHLAAFRQLRDDAADMFNDRRLYAFGGFVKNEDSRPGGQCTSDRQLLLLAAREITAATPWAWQSAVLACWWGAM